MNGLALDGCAGPGGWSEALRMLGIPEVGIERDAAACQTRAAAGHKTIRADIAGFDTARLAGKIAGVVFSPPCTVFSAAGKRAGASATDILAEGIRDAFAGRKTRALRRRQMAAALRAAWWPSAKLTRAERSAKIVPAALSASLVLEPARFIAAGMPEWVALEQVPSVLPLWKVYAEELRKLGYSVWTGKLNAADYGVPQTRERAILIASRVRTVRRPTPTHYDPRKGMQLWGTPWVSMADALGWGATGRPGPAVTAGGTATGGAEPFPTRARELLEAERDAGAWVLHTNRDQRPDGTRQNADPRSAPAPALTAKSGGQWVLKQGAQARATERPAPAPAPTIAFGHDAASMRWVFRNNNNNNACERSPDEPAGTLFFGGRSNWAAFTDGKDSVRITVQEAAILQSFRPDYPWQGTRTKQFEQCGNAWCPRAAAAVIGEATGLDWQSAVAREYGESEEAA